MYLRVLSVVAAFGLASEAGFCLRGRHNGIPDAPAAWIDEYRESRPLFPGPGALHSPGQVRAIRGGGSQPRKRVMTCCVTMIRWEA